MKEYPLLLRRLSGNCQNIGYIISWGHLAAREAGVLSEQ